MEEPRDAPAAKPSPKRETVAERTERALDQAIKAGFFDNLPGSGKPLDLSDEDNPFIPDDMRLAYRILRNAGYSLPWIELRKEIEAQVASLEQQATAHAATVRSSRESIRRAPAYLRANRWEQLKARHEQFLVAHAEAIDALNKRIDDFNLSVPVVPLQLRRVNRQSWFERLASLLPSDL